MLEQAVRLLCMFAFVWAAWAIPVWRRAGGIPVSRVTMIEKQQSWTMNVTCIECENETTLNELNQFSRFSFSSHRKTYFSTEMCCLCSLNRIQIAQIVSRYLHDISENCRTQRAFFTILDYASNVPVYRKNNNDFNCWVRESDGRIAFSFIWNASVEWICEVLIVCQFVFLFIYFCE